MKPYAVLLGVLVSGGCASAGMATSDGNGQPIDAPHGHGDAPAGHDGSAEAIDAPQQHDAPPPTPTSLLLSEVMLGPAGGEFIEIVNPTPASVDLSTYYLADRGDYFQLPEGGLASVSSDFIAQFPAGSSIAAGAVVTVSVGTAASFNTVTNHTPTYSVADGTMRKTLVGASASLTDAGEIVVLFQWDGTSPLVKDVDILLAGAPTAGNSFVNKSQVTEGGSTYAVDVNSLPTQSPAPAPGTSTKRILLEAGHENQNGNGNGITGDDETSEVTSVTWDSGTFTGPTPGIVPAALTP